MNSRRLNIVFIPLCVILASCASVESENSTVAELATPVATQALKEKVAETDSEMETTAEVPLPKKNSESDLAQHPQLLVQLNKQVDVWVKHFTTKGKDSFEESLRRGAPFRSGIESTLKESGIPAEFFYLSLIESGFTTHAVSHAGAVGFWQFMPGTAKRYGLDCDRGYDERRDPIRATKAAAAYLRDLYNVFGSWRLAMAAYNAGEYRILSAIMRGKTRDFWTLVEKKVLPKETMDYVPKFYAAAIVAKNPKKYGLSLIESDNKPKIVGVEIPSPVSLKAVAQVSGIEERELRKLNPHLQMGHTPTWRSRYRLWVPFERAQWLETKRHQLTAMSLKIVRSQPRQIASTNRVRRPVQPTALAQAQRLHRVKPGDTLYSISRRYGISIQWLKRTNALKSSRLPVGRKLVIARVGDERGSRRVTPNT